MEQGNNRRRNQLRQAMISGKKVYIFKTVNNQKSDNSGGIIGVSSSISFGYAFPLGNKIGGRKRITAEPAASAKTIIKV